MNFNQTYNYANELIFQEKYEDAIKILKRLYKFEPDNVHIGYKLAKILILTSGEKNVQDGMTILKKLINMYEIDYNNPIIKYLSMYKLGKIYYKKTNLKEAEFYLQGAVNYIYDNDIINGVLENKKYGCIYFLGRTYMDQHKFDEAINEFSSLLNTSYNNNAIYNIIFIKIREEKYNEAYEYFNMIDFKNDCEYTKKSRKIEFFLKFKLGLLNNEELQNKYYYNQLLKYNEEDAINHIHLRFENEGEKRIISNNSISLDTIYNDIKERIKDINPTSYSLEDKYIIKYDNIIAQVDGIDTNMIMVITFPNTKNIITMYPILLNMDNNDSDINYAKEDIKQKQLKRESQIDKFNRKYSVK